MNNFIRYHPRFWISIIVGVVGFFFLPTHWSVISRVLFCWNGGVMLFLGLIYHWMTRMTPELICSRYSEEDESARLILVTVVLAAALSLAAIAEPLATLKQVTGTERTTHILLAAFTLINSWLLVPTLFTTHYADMFYSVRDDQIQPLGFPHTPKPAFWDFAYFSFTIAAACQTSDVITNNADMRRMVLAHTIISFVFNISILGFAINVTAGLIGGN